MQRTEFFCDVCHEALSQASRVAAERHPAGREIDFTRHGVHIQVDSTEMHPECRQRLEVALIMAVNKAVVLASHPAEAANQCIGSVIRCAGCNGPVVAFEGDLCPECRKNAEGKEWA